MTFLELLHKEQVAIIIFSCCFGAILLDWLACLPTEIKYIYSVDLKNLAHGKLPTLPSFLLFVPRLLTIPLVALCYALVLGRTVECTMMWKILLSIYSICTINSFTIFAVRTIVSRPSCFSSTLYWFIIFHCHHRKGYSQQQKTNDLLPGFPLDGTKYCTIMVALQRRLPTTTSNYRHCQRLWWSWFRQLLMDSIPLLW